MPPLTPLDLHSIATLANYERASTEPRFRHAKLRELATTGSFETLRAEAAYWGDRKVEGRVGYVFDTRLDGGVGGRGEEERDVVGNMVPLKGGHASVLGLSEREKEVIYWQARGHDGCYKSIVLLQHFFDFYPPSTPLLLRLPNGTSFLSPISTRIILEFTLFSPKFYVLSTVLPSAQSFLSGLEKTTVHAVWGFAAPGSENVSHVLDLSSLQFGEPGRGKGGETFALGTIDGFYDMVERVAQDCEPLKGGVARIGKSPDDEWLRGCAGRVRERWEGGPKGWCGYCGAPEPRLKCGGCKEVFYCGKSCSVGGWKFHKKWCAPAKK